MWNKKGNRMKKVIIMDIDGTLYNSKKTITPKTKEVLLRAEEKGAILILASGRPTVGLYDIAKELEMNKYNGLLVSYNGSCVSSYKTGEILFNQTLSKEEVKAILTHLKKFPRVRPMPDKDGIMYVTDVFDCYITYNSEPFNVLQYESRGNKFKLCEVDDLAEFCDFELNKIITTADPEYLQEHHVAMAEPFKDTINSMFTGDFYYEYTAKGIDKAKALDTVLRPMGYTPEDMIAFGDGQNDISMMQYASVGVAMGNAHEKVKEIADEITLSNNEDGIAVTLEKYGF